MICACFAEFIPEGMDGDGFLEKAVGPTCDLLRQGKRVLVHCNGGKGRTGAVTLPAASVVACKKKRMHPSASPLWISKEQEPIKMPLHAGTLVAACLISLSAGSRPKALRTHSAQCLHVNVQPVRIECPT